MVRLSSMKSDWLEEDSVQIVISGTYLRDFGFSLGTKVVVEVTDKSIVIKPIEVEDD